MSAEIVKIDQPIVKVSLQDETVEEKIISRKLDNVPVGQIARELVLWDNMSEDEAEKMVSETEPSDNDMSAKSLFNKKYSELNENELEEMELYDV